jgi:hypothetical protein
MAYNQEAAQTKGNTILLNILRSASHRPLQFTEYSTATAQSNLSGQIGASAPVAVIPTSVARTFMLNPQVAASAQTQVQVTNVNSQEFYYGIQAPLSQQMLGTFAAVGHDPLLVFMLGIASIRRTSNTQIDEIENDANNSTTP